MKATNLSNRSRVSYSYFLFNVGMACSKGSTTRSVEYQIRERDLVPDPVAPSTSFILACVRFSQLKYTSASILGDDGTTSHFKSALLMMGAAAGILLLVSKQKSSKLTVICQAS